MTSYDDTKVQLTINRMTGECYENVPNKSSTELYLISQNPTSIAKIDLDAQEKADAEISSLSAWTSQQIGLTNSHVSALETRVGEIAAQVEDNTSAISENSDAIDELQNNISALSAWDITQDSLISELSTQTTSNSTDISALGVEIQEVSANMSKSIIRRWAIIEGLRFVAEEANSTLAMQKVGSAPDVSLEYNTGDGWNDFIVGTTTVTLANVGDDCFIRAKTPNLQLATSNDNRNTFSMTGQVEVSGNLAAIFNKDEEQGAVLDNTLTHHLCGLFQDCTSLVGSAKGLVIPFETLYGDSLNSLFRNTRITIAPDLPCMNVGIGSYSTMFRDCTSLTTAPELPATAIANYSYYHMFENCTALGTPPSVLPATSPHSECYRQMFINCTSLTRTPDIKMQNIWSSSPNMMLDMFKNCSSLETAMVNHMEQVNGNNGMAYMFLNCTSLKNVGLKSLSNVNNSRGILQMLYGCSALEVVDFSEATSVPTLHSVNTFQNTNSTFQIVVPDALYDQWIAANNWSRFASQIVKASEYINN